MVCNFLLKAISFITVPIFTRILSESDYGIVNVFNGWHDIIFVFGTLNLFYSAYNTANIKYKDDLDGFTSSMLGLIAVVCLALVVVYLAAKPVWDSLFELSPTIMLIILVELLTVPAFNFWMARQRFIYQYRNVVLLTIIVSISAPLLSMLLIKMASIDYAFYKILGTAIPSVAAGLFFTWMAFYKGRTFYHKEYWVYGLKFNIPLIPHYLSGTVLNQSDRIMISMIVSNAKAGIYSVAYSASFTISLVTSALNHSLIPWMYGRMKEQDYSAIQKRTSQILVAFGVILMLFILIIPELIMLLAPSSYGEATKILPVLVISVFFQFLYGFFGNVEFYFENSVFPMIASVIAAVSNIVTNLIFIPRFGYFAAAYTTLFSFVIMAIAHFVFMKIVLLRQGIKSNIFHMKSIVSISLGIIAVGLCESVLYDHALIRYAFLLAACVAAYCFRKRIIGLVRFK